MVFFFAPISCGSGANERRLIQCTVEMTRCRLDRTYLEALGAASLSPGEADAGEVEALREEVDSLYAEIFPVVQMSVENQFMRPAERRVRGREARALGNSAVAIDYVRLSRCDPHVPLFLPYIYYRWNSRGDGN